MPKLPFAHRVRIHDVYTVAEAAEVTGTSRETVRRWIKEGLPATAEKPFLIEGVDLKRWLLERRNANRRPLGPAEIYCLPCRGPKQPAGDLTELRPGRGGQAMLIGICPDCERLMHRIVSPKDLEQITAEFDLENTSRSERL